jgi:hypothetical protein
LALVVGEMYSVLVGSFEGKRSNRGRQDNIKMNLKGIEWEGVGFI